MWRTYASLLMVAAGLVVFLYAHDHRPSLDPMANEVLSTGAYNWLHVGAWALVALGVLTLLLQVVRGYRSAPRR
jgi:hypothetical protein